MTSDSISLRQLAEMTTWKYKTAAKFLERHTEIKRFYVPTERGRELRISTQSLIEHGVITHAELSRLASLEEVRTEANRLMASLIVRKKFRDLTPAEEELLQVLDVGRDEKDAVSKIAKRLDVSKAWLYREHNVERTKRQTAWDAMTNEQRRRVEFYFIQIRLFSNFVKECRKDDLLPLLSYNTWRKIWMELSRTHADEKLLRQKGVVALRQSTQPSLRDRTRLKLMELCSADYWRVDVITEWPDGDFITPHLCVIREERTMRIVGAALTKYPNSLGVKTALFSTFANVGVMGTLYIDNGKEFTALRIIGPKKKREWTYDSGKALLASDVVEDVRRFNALGFLEGMRVKVHRAAVKNPRAKGAERSFGIGGLSDLAESLCGWTGRKYWEKPETVADALNAAKKGEVFVNKMTGEIVRFMRYDELCEALRRMIDTLNNNNSTGYGMNGLSPNQKWLELSATQKVYRPPLAKIAFAFLEGKEVTVRQTGLIEYKKDIFYTAPENELRDYRRQRVHIRYNPVSDGEWLGNGENDKVAWVPRTLYVFNLQGEFITEAYIQERHHPIEASDREMASDRARKRDLIRETEESLRQIVQEGSPAPVVVDIKNAPKAIVEQEQAKRQLRLEDAQQKEIRWWLDRKKSFKGNNEVQIMCNLRLQGLGYDIDVEDGCVNEG